MKDKLIALARLDAQQFRKHQEKKIIGGCVAEDEAFAAGWLRGVATVLQELNVLGIRPDILTYPRFSQEITAAILDELAPKPTDEVVIGGPF